MVTTRAYPRARRWATCISRCATWTRPRTSTTAALGFEPTARNYPGALFVSAGGYHHHLGLNTWGTAGAPPPPSGARGLRAVRVVVPSDAELSRVAGRLEARGIGSSRSDEGLRITDPAGNPVLVQVRGGATT